MITDAELYELERLFIEKYKDFNFETLLFNELEQSILIKDKGLIDLVKLSFADRFEEAGPDIIISYYVFGVLQFRYFRDNETVPIIINK